MRTYEYRRNLPHYQKDDRAHYVTFVTNRRWKLLSVARDIVMKSCHHMDGERFDLYAVVVMPDHVHLIFESLQDELGEDFTFAETVGAIKSFTAHEINRVLARKGHVWQDESFDHVVRFEGSLEEKIEYVRQNPVRAGLVKISGEYQWLYVKDAQPGTAVPHALR
jgi:REP element-mobilizing transposase RayT